MSERVRTAERIIEELSAEELTQFATWFADFQDSLWEKQIERDSEAGRLDSMIDRVDGEIDSGLFRPI